MSEPKPMKPITKSIVVTPKGEGLVYTLSNFDEEAITEFLDHRRAFDWESFAKRGYRVQRVEIREVTR